MKSFRHAYLSHDELTAALRHAAGTHPNIVRLESIGRSPEGRDLWLAIVGRDPDRLRPAAWVDGNMHASELAGSSVALGILEDLLRIHTHPDEPVHGISAHVRTILREGLVYVCPRISPDGAEAVLRTGKYVRSVPRDGRPNQEHAYWRSHDVDGDGLALVMRKQDPTGELVESKEFPGLLVVREIDDEGPFYKLYPEGSIENYDGRVIPSPDFLADNEPDLNRNFPYDWRAEPEQVGAGAFPTSSPEARAIVEWVSRRPNIFAWLNLHTFGGVFIRPLGHAADAKMNQFDLAVFRQLEAWGKDTLGYPMVSGFEEFTYEPEKPLHGDMSSWAYHDRGALAWVTELWDLFEQVGLPKKKKFVDRYVDLRREDLVAIARWDQEHNAGRVLRPWAPFDHPQLGKVEVGGLDPRIGLWNPPPERLDEVCRAQSAMFLRVAAMMPRLVLSAPRHTSLGGGLFRIELDIENRGYLPTYFLGSAKKLPLNEPLVAHATTEGCELVNVSDARQPVDHLDGWGRGVGDGTAGLYYMRTKGSTSRKRLHWIVRGGGSIHIRIGSCRVGYVQAHIEV